MSRGRGKGVSIENTMNCAAFFENLLTLEHDVREKHQVGECGQFFCTGYPFKKCFI